jgi:hypothetical protein
LLTDGKGSAADVVLSDPSISMNGIPELESRLSGVLASGQNPVPQLVQTGTIAEYVVAGWLWASGAFPPEAARNCYQHKFVDDKQRWRLVLEHEPTRGQ